MLNTRSLLLLCMILLIIGCGQQRSTTVGEGFLQKRKHLSGWHLDLGLRKPRTTLADERATKERHSPVEQAALETSGPPAMQVEARPATAPPVDEPLAQLENVIVAAPHPLFTNDQSATIALGPPDRDTSNIMPRKRFNVLAIPALLFVAAGITFAFTTNSGLLVAGMLVVGLVLAAISLRRIRSQEQSGKGFALTALILGVLAALITTMVIIRTGF